MVTTQIIEDIKIKYPSSQGGGLRNQGCMSTRLSYNSDHQGKMLGCPKLEEIVMYACGASSMTWVTLVVFFCSLTSVQHYASV